MNYTSAQANKRLKKLTDEYVSLREKESRSREFRAAAGENVEVLAKYTSNYYAGRRECGSRAPCL